MKSSSQMDKTKTSRLTLFFRYFVLTVMTLVLTAMVGASFWMVHLFIRYQHVFPGFYVYNIDDSGAWWDISVIRNQGYLEVYAVDPNSAADKAGIQPGDSVVAVNGIRLKEKPQAFFRAFIGARSGKEIKLELKRKGVTERRVLTLEENILIESPQGFLGINSRWVTQQIADSLNLKSTRGILLDGVIPGTGAAKAGLKVGDVVQKFDGKQFLNDHQFLRLIRATPPGKKVAIELLRNGETLTIEAALGKRAPLSWTVFGFPMEGSPNKVIWSFYLPYLLLSAFFLLIGAPIGWLKVRDYVAFQCSILFLCFGIVSIIAEVPFLASWPYWTLAVWLCLVEISGGLCLPLILRVLSIFPNPSRLGRILLKWQWVAWLCFGLSSYSWCADDLAQLYGWKSTWFVANPVTHFFVKWLGSEGVMLIVAILMGSLGIAQRVETRHRPEARLKIIEFGFVLAILGLIAYLSLRWMYKIVPESWGPTYGFLTWYLPLILIIALPLSFAYSILARKVFGIRFIIRKGLQHLLLSKGALLFEGVIIFFIVLQIIRQGGTRLASSPAAVSGLALGSGLLGAIVLSRVNRKLMPVIDRRFFRETLDVRHLLLELGDQLSELREREKILRRTAVTVLKALHPLRVVLLFREGKTNDIKCALDLKNGTSRLASIEDLEKEVVSNPSLELKSEDSAIQQLEHGKPWLAVYPEKLDPENEQERRLLELNCELLILLPGSSGLIGVMGLGAKLSEEPFSGEDRELLLTVTRQMGMALENAELLEVAKREAEFSRELEIARQVQQNLFPKKLPTSSGWEFAAACRPARVVGGDYYDVLELPERKVLIALGDVSGKGLGASLLMASVHASIRSRAGAADRPRVLAAELNRLLVSSSAPETFVTLFLGVLDLETGTLVYTNCGHPPAMLLRKDSQRQLERLEQGGPLLGILDNAAYAEGSCQLENGDMLLLFSDGVTEAVNQKGEMFEEEGVVRLLSSTKVLVAQTILNTIFSSVDNFAAGFEQSDDISVAVVLRNPSENTS